MTSTAKISTEQLLAHSDWARALARRLVTDAATAEDVVQQTWIAALQARPDVGHGLTAWLERVLRNFASKERRSRRTRQRHENAAAEAPKTCPPAADVVARAEGQQRIVAAVLALAEPYRSVVLLRYFEGLSAAEIARRTDTPAGTVRWQLSTGLGKLRERLDRDADGDTHAWCAALLPLAASPPPTGTAAGTFASARSSFVSVLKGVTMMKVVWSLGAALGAVLLFLFYQSALGILPATPAVGGGVPVSEVASQPQPPQVHVPRQPVVAERADPGAEPAAPPWQATVRVRFVDAQGTPVAGVAARFPRQPAVVSDHDGRVVVDVPKPFGDRSRHRSSLVVRAVADGFANVQREVSAALLDGNGDAIELGDIVLEAGGSIEGTVVDDRGQPVAGARVEVEGRAGAAARTGNLLAAVPMSRNRVGLGSAKTDAAGRYRIDGVLPGHNECTASHHPGEHMVDELWCERTVNVTAGASSQLDLTLARRFALDDVLTVEVLSPSGEPVARAMVEAQSSRGNSRTYTDADGIARCAFAGSGRTVDLTVSAPDQRFARIVHEDAVLGTTCTIRFAEAVTMPLALTSDAGHLPESVDVRLTTVASGGLFGFGGSRATELFDGSCAVARHDGTVTGLVVPAERFLVEVVAAGHEQGRFGPFAPQQGAQGLSLELVACPMVRGTVTGPDGRAVAGVTVAMHRRPERRMTYNGFRVWLDPQPQQEVVTGEQGGFELTVRGELPFFLRVTADDFAAAMTRELQVADTAEPLAIRLDQGGSVSGHVTSASGAPAAGSIVVANRGDGFAVTTRVAADGSYRFERLTPGPYQIRPTGADIHPDESSWQTSLGSPPRALDAPDCEVVAGTETRFDIGPRHSLDASLQGRIELAGIPLAGQRVHVEPADVAEGRVASDRWHALLGADGRFSLSALPSEPVLLRAAVGRLLIEARVELAPGRNEFDLSTATREVLLRDLPCAAADGSEVYVMARWTRGGTTIRLPVPVGDDGTAKVTLPVGEVVLERSPTEADLGALLANGGFLFVPLRTIRIE